MKIGAVDLFCGAGGLSYGLKQAGLNVLAGLDFDKRCEFAYEYNCKAKFLHQDISKISATDLEPYYQGSDIRVLAGCAPCQPFSSYSQSRKSIDNRWLLLKEFQRIAIELMPDIITMENVSKLARLPIWEEFKLALENEGYYVSWDLVRCEDFGVPQTRKRLVLIASRIGEINMPVPSTKAKRISVREAISHLPKLSAGKQHASDELHKSSGLNETNLKRIKASRPGGTWRDWPKELIAKCHTKSTGKSYPSVYGRMSWDKPSPTITTQFYGFGNGRFGHPEQNRAISIREGAILQSFPQNYKFASDDSPIMTSVLGTLIGNAVPPKLGEAIGASILDHVKGYAAEFASR